MLKRLAVASVLAWLLGFAWFALTLPQPHTGGKTDGVIVLTGGEGDDDLDRMAGKGLRLRRQRRQ